MRAARFLGRLAAASLLLAIAAFAQAQPFPGCPGKPIADASADFGRTGSGLDLNAIQNARQVELYLQSVARLRSLTQASPPIQVHLTTHPFATGLMDLRPALAERAPGSANPFVDPAGFVATLDELAAGARERLAIERAKTTRP